MAMPRIQMIDVDDKPQFDSWEPAALANALRGMAYDGDPANKERKALLLECATRLIMFDTVSRLSGKEHNLDGFYRRIMVEKNKIQAIKLYRENTGSTLIDAKNYIESL